MGACAQIAVFTYAVMRRRPRYEIRLAAFFADNLMNGVAHCGEQPINVERPLRHIYELGAWLVTWGCRRLANAAKRNAIGSVFLLTILGIAWLIADVTNLSSPYWYY